MNDEVSRIERTQSGYRVSVTWHKGQGLWAQLIADAVFADGQQNWYISELFISAGTIKPQAIRLLRHWLNFFEDSELADAGETALLDVYDEIPNRGAVVTTPTLTTQVN